MATIKEDYVSFETAKLLKEKGFDIDCSTAYFNGVLVDYTMFGFCDGELLPAPSLSLACKWLREVHKLIPIVLTGGDSQNPFYYWFRIDRITKEKLEDAIYREDEKEFSSYEAAEEAAIKYCLEHLI